LCKSFRLYLSVLPQGLSLGGKIYTVTEYSADRTIALHNENSYSNLRPTKIFFFSVTVAKEEKLLLQTEENDRISLILRSLGEKICHVIYFMEMDNLLKLKY